MRLISLAAAVLFSAAPLLAWTPASDLRIAQKSAALAPNDMRLILEKFSDSYRRGITEGASDEGSEGHHYYVATNKGKLRDRIQSETSGVIRALRGREPMAQVAEQLGVLAHLVADANNPFHVANDDARLEASHLDFEHFFESRIQRFPTVFYGLAGSFNPARYFDQTFERTKRFYPLMSEEYFRFGERRSSADFDDRSTAFGVASVCYSHAVTDLVNVYYYIWKEAGGDVRSAGAMRRGNLTLNEH